MWCDPVVAETRAWRDEYARQFHYDMDAMYEDLIAKQAEHPERISFKPVFIRCVNEKNFN